MQNRNVLLFRYVVSAGKTVAVGTCWGGRGVFTLAILFGDVLCVIIANASRQALIFAALHECALHCAYF